MIVTQTKNDPALRRGRFFLHLTLCALFICEREQGAQTYEDVDELHEPWPTTKQGLDEVEAEQSDQAPVQTTDPKKPKRDAMSIALAIFHHKRSETNRKTLRA